MIIVTHEHEIADNAKRIVTFKDGRIMSDSRRQPIHEKYGVDNVTESAKPQEEVTP
jgi:ABC-type lipoprotein export system ATPase subunit